MEGLICLYAEGSPKPRSLLPLELAQTVSVRKCRPGEKPGMVFPNYKEDGTCKKVRPYGQTTLEYDGPVEVEPKLTQDQYDKMLLLMIRSKRRRSLRKEIGALMERNYARFWAASGCSSTAEL